MELAVSNEGQENEILYLKTGDSVDTLIRYHENTDSYSLVESDKNTGEILYVVNDTNYKIIAEGENINMYSENGEIMPILITEHVESPNINNTASDSKLSSAVMDTKSVVTPNASFGTNYGPFYKTNKVIVNVLSDIGQIGSFITFVHPVIGTVSAVIGTVAWVAGKAYATLYIEYYQAIDTADSTHYRQTDYYYQYSNYSGFLKTNIWYFYTSRPY